MRARPGLTLTAFVAIAAALFGQTAQPPLTFEVASVKPHPSRPGEAAGSTESGGPGTKDPERIVIVNRTLRTLIITAYGIRGFQIEHPAWMGEKRYDIVAKVPAGASRQESRIMMRNLLAERFHVVIRRETRELPVYILTVDKNGLKMKSSGQDTSKPAAPTTTDPGKSNRVTADKSGMPQLTPGEPGVFTIYTSGVARTVAQRQSISKILTLLSDYVDRPVLDGTGLKGEYDFTITWEPEGTQGAEAGSPLAGGTIASSLYEALQRQLGLKLEPRRAPIEMLVVVSADKVPVEN